MAKLTLFWIAVAAVVVPAPAQRLTPAPDTKAQVDKIFARYDRRDSPGCSVGASIDGNPVLGAAYGMADLEHDVPLTPETIFEPGSITKQFTAASVLLLVEQGKLSLDDPVRKYIPEVPDYGTPITIRHLLNHTSGLRDWGGVESIAGWPRTTREYTHAHVLEIVSRQKSLNYPPGAEYSYTNTGYNLAAILVGRVAGKSLPEFSREQIFLPLGMSSTGWRDDFRRIVRNRAIAYSQSGGTFRQLMPFEDVYGNGGLLTTVGDLLRWNRNFVEKKVGGAAFVDAQLQRGRLTGGRTIAYAAGLMVLHWKGLPEVSHSGSTAGYSAWLGRYPEQGLSVAVLCNVTTNATQLGHQVADVYLAGVEKPEEPRQASYDASKTGLYRSLRDHSTMTLAPGNPRAQFTPDGGLEMVSETDTVRYEMVERANPTAAELEALAGEYTSDEAEVTLRVAVEPGRLVIHRRPDTVIPLTATYQDGFNSSLGSVRFLRDGSGKVNALSVGDSRVWDLRFRKVR